MDLNYKRLLPKSGFWEVKADRICELYATKVRLMHPRAIGERYSFPGVDTKWPMLAQSIAGHAFVMAQMIGALYIEFLDLLPVKGLSVERLESEALHHDDAEALTGDAATDVDGVTRFMKDAVESKSIERQYCGLACYSHMRTRYESYEARESYTSKLVKMLDAVELVLYAQYCVKNGVGMISREENGEFVLNAFGLFRSIDRRAYGEISDYFKEGKRTEVPISEIMYDHSLPRVEKMGHPELTALFKLICARAFEFPFDEYNLVNLPMDFAGITKGTASYG